MADVAAGAGGLSQREFRLGQVLSKSFEVFFKHLVVFTLVAALIWLPAGLAGFYIESAPPELRGFAPFVILAFTFFLQPLSTAIILYGAFQHMRGRSFNLGEAIAGGLARFFPLLGVMLLGTLAIMLGLILLLIPGLILMVMWYVAVPVCVVEKAGPVQSLSRSQELTKGFRWKLFGLYILAVVIGMVGGAILPVLGAAVAGTIGAFVLQTVWQGVAQAFGSVLIVVAYHDLRAVKEGVDIERIASVFD